jgi:hypothetical protein
MFAKNELFLELLNIHKRTKTLKTSKKHIVSIQKQPPPTFNFVLASNFFFFTAHCSKKQKTIEIRGQLIKNRLFPVPKSHTQMGSISVKT